MPPSNAWRNHFRFGIRFRAPTKPREADIHGHFPLFWSKIHPHDFTKTLFLFIMLIIEPSALCAELGSQQEELMATIARPTTTLEVLRNFKFALDNDLFLRDDFYTDENLQKFFAADRISWHGGIPTHSFGNAFTRLSIDFSLIQGTIDAEGNPVANGRKHGGGTISTTLTADSVIEVFHWCPNVVGRSEYNRLIVFSKMAFSAVIDLNFFGRFPTSAVCFDRGDADVRRPICFHASHGSFAACVSALCRALRW
jgi:hypothetical protein